MTEKAEKTVKLKVRDGFVAWTARADKEGNIFETPHEAGSTFEVPEAEVENHLAQCEVVTAGAAAK